MLLSRKSSVGAHYGWWLVGIGVLILTLAGGNLILSFGRILYSGNPEITGAALAWAFAWPQQVSLALLVLAGLAVDRFGPRPMMLAGLSLCAAAAIAASLIPVLGIALALFPVLMAGILMGTNVPVMAAINHWFHRRRALAIAVVLFAVLALEMLPLPVFGSGQANTLVFATLILAVGLPLAAQAHRPGDLAGRTDNADVSAVNEGNQWDDGHPTVEYGWVEAVRSREFWLLTAAATCLSVVDQLTGTLIIGVADYRFQAEGSYRIFGEYYDLASVLFILVGGLVSMKVRLRSALPAFAVFHVIAVAMVTFAPSELWLIAGMLVMGAGGGGIRALSISAVGEYFGRRRFATLLGTQGFLSGTLTLAFAAILLWISTFTHNPTWPLAAAIAPAAAGTLAYRMLGDPKPAPSQTPRIDGAQVG